MTPLQVTWIDASAADVGIAETDVPEAHHHEGEPAAVAHVSQSFPKERKGIRKLSPKNRKPSPPFQRLRGSLS